MSISSKQRRLGRVVVTTTHEYDDSPDIPHLGEWSKFQYPGKGEVLIHRAEGVGLGSDGLWRDIKGRIQPEPEPLDSYGREYRFTFHNDSGGSVKYALQDSARLESLNDGHWSFIGITTK